MRYWIFALILVAAMGVTHASMAAADDTVQGLIAACDAGDQVCLMDVLSGMQKAIFVGQACPDPDLHEDEALDAVIPWLKDAVAKDPGLATRKSDETVVTAVKQLYPCKPDN